MLHLLPFLLAVFAQNDAESLADPAEPAITDKADAYGAITLPEFRIDDLPMWREFLLPTPTESAFASIPWQPTFADGIRRAEAVTKPMLLWVMNGHPLGCT